MQETRAVGLRATQDVKLTAALTLPPGLYQGIEERVGIDSIAGPSWTIKYKITLAEEQLAIINPDLRSLHFLNMDVTEFVRQGQLTICDAP